jgi:hypothetical protein
VDHRSLRDGLDDLRVGHADIQLHQNQAQRGEDCRDAPAETAPVDDRDVAAVVARVVSLLPASSPTKTTPETTMYSQGPNH